MRAHLEQKVPIHKSVCENTREIATATESDVGCVARAELWICVEMHKGATQKRSDSYQVVIFRNSLFDAPSRGSGARGRRALAKGNHLEALA